MEFACGWNFKVPRVPCGKWSCAPGTIFAGDYDIREAIQASLGIKYGSAESIGPFTQLYKFDWRRIVRDKKFLVQYGISSHELEGVVPRALMSDLSFLEWGVQEPATHFVFARDCEGCIATQHCAKKIVDEYIDTCCLKGFSSREFLNFLS